MKIGIPGNKKGDYFGIGETYYSFFTSLKKKETEIVILTPFSEIRNDLDLLVIPGGSDINPESFGCVPDIHTGSSDPFKEYFEKVILPEYIERRIPILGICRGHQALAIHFGCILNQHKPHETNDSYSPGEAVHSLHLKMSKENPLYVEKIKVNSRHHQCIDQTYFFPSELRVLATHSDGTIECFSHLDQPLVGVQWHPEDCTNSNAQLFIYNIISKLIKREIV